MLMEINASVCICAILFLALNECSFQSDLDNSIIELGLKIADGSITDIDTIANHIQQWVLPQLRH
ncbi:MAG: hypothetical protein OXD54_02545 [Candidatus Poribacteria bacterium]|nr:hypothetical protein [Candidatus Poribacteria bacterium]